MGIDYQGLRCLLAAKQSGVSFERSIMYGRQQFSVSLKNAAFLFDKYGHSIGRETIEGWLAAGYIEPLLKHLGSVDITSVDASNYEGATVIHDMNLPLPTHLKNKFSVAMDFGTLEHVFNYPQALKNAMESVALGGHFLATTICNGWAGHGFYQFSPELFFRVFSDDNGFALDHQYICQTNNGGEWYRCIDPFVLKRRAEFSTACPTYLLIQARRIKICDIFSAAPQQSDYVPVWRGKEIGQSPPNPPLPNPPLWKRMIPGPVKRALRKPFEVRKQRAQRLILTDRIAFPLVDK